MALINEKRTTTTRGLLQYGVRLSKNIEWVVQYKRKGGRSPPIFRLPR